MVVKGKARVKEILEMEMVDKEVPMEMALMEVDKEMNPVVDKVPETKKESVVIAVAQEKKLLLMRLPKTKP